MGKVVRAVALIAITVAIAVYAPQLLPAALGKIGTALAVAALTVGASLAFNAIFPPPSAKAASGGGALQVTRQSISNSYLIYGKRRAGGLMAFYHPKGKDFRYYVIAHAGHRCQGVVEWYLNDEAVTIDGSGKVTSGPYANHAWLWFARGTDDQEANATFVAECDGQWTAAHRGRGVAATYAKFEMVDAVVQAGMPLITAVIEGKDDVVDPRTGTAGFTRLATPIIYDWFAMPREEGGFGASVDEIPDDAVLAAWTNICDEDVAVAGGAEKRYELAAWITTGGAPSELRQTLMTCCAGTYAYVEGRFMLRPGYWNPVSASLHEDDLAGPIVVPALANAEDVATEASGTFIDPTNGWQSMPVPTHSVPSSDVRQMDIDLPHITSSARGERIVEIMLRRAQCEKKVTWPMNIAGLEVSALDTISLGTSRYGLSNYAWVVDGWGLASDFGVTMQLREENEDIYADPSSYGGVAAAPALAVADPIGEQRAAYQLRSQTIAFPLGSNDTTITVSAFDGVIDDGRTISFPSGTIIGLSASTQYGVFWSIAAAAYASEIAPAATHIASSEFVFVGWSTTSDTTGTFPTSPTPPGGWGGQGPSGGQLP